MAKIVYFLYLFSQFVLKLIPVRLMYVLSSFVYYVLFYVVKYRRNIAESNMKACFSDWSKEELNQRLKTFYKYLSDLFIEGLMSGIISIKHLEKNISICNPEVLNTIQESGRNSIVLLGHYCNWEWCAIRYAVANPIQGISVYNALKNKRIDKHVRISRQRTGLIMYNIDEFRQAREKIFDKQCMLFLIADQNPSNVDHAYWCDFFGTTLPWFKGPEIMCKNNDVDVYFGRLAYESRGKYKLTLEDLPYDKNKPGDLTIKFIERLEDQLKNQPEYWLWTHKRWKRAHLYDQEKHITLER